MPKREHMKKPTFEVDEHPATRDHLRKIYNPESHLGRVLLAQDADGLNSKEKALLLFFATKCGGPKADACTTFVEEETMVFRTCMGLSSVKRGLDNLVERELITRKKRKGTSWITTVHWGAVRDISYRWRTMLTIEEEAAERKASDGAPAKPSKPTKKISDCDEDDAILDSLDASPATKQVEAQKAVSAPRSVAPEPKVEQDLYEGDKADFDQLMQKARCGRAAYCYRTNETPLSLAKKYCAKHACVVLDRPFRYEKNGEIGTDDTFLQIVLPLHEHAAIRLSQQTGRTITPSSLIHLAKKSGADHYSIFEYALFTEEWCSMLAAASTRSPVAMLMAKWDDIVTSWTEEGALVYLPPADESANATPAEPVDDEEMPREAKEEARRMVASA